MNQRLFIKLQLNDKGDLVTEDMTPYEHFGEDIYNHVVIERVLDYTEHVVNSRMNVIVDEDDFKFLRCFEPLDLPSDGLYTYQKLILPLKEHAGNTNCYYDDERLYVDGEVATFEEV